MHVVRFVRGHSNGLSTVVGDGHRRGCGEVSVWRAGGGVCKRVYGTNWELVLSVGPQKGMTTFPGTTKLYTRKDVLTKFLSNNPEFCPSLYAPS